MNKQVMAFAASLIIAASSCTKKGSSSGTTSTTSSTLNSTETSLVGKWFLIKQEQDWAVNTSMSRDTTFTTTSTAVYLDLLSDSYSGGASGVPENYKKATDARAGITGITTASGVGYWFYDEAANRLTITGSQWEKISQTSTSLVIRKTDMNSTITQTFKK